MCLLFDDIDSLDRLASIDKSRAVFQRALMRLFVTPDASAMNRFSRKTLVHQRPIRHPGAIRVQAGLGKLVICIVNLSFRAVHQR